MEYTGREVILRELPPQNASEELVEVYKGKSWTGEEDDNAS